MSGCFSRRQECGWCGRDGEHGEDGDAGKRRCCRDDEDGGDGEDQQMLPDLKTDCSLRTLKLT